MSTWRTKLKPGKFREVPFFVDSSQYQGGRRLQVHEFPLRDLPYAEDLGRKARQFQLELYVLNPWPADPNKPGTYMDARDALMKALETPGPGTLSHPFLGTLQVAVGAYSMSENFSEGGKATFSVPFMEAGALQEPDGGTDTQSVVKTAADNATTKLQSNFLAKFSVLTQAKWVSDAAVAKVNEITKTMNDISNLANVPAGAQQLIGLAQGLSNGATALVSAPADLAGAIIGTIALIPSIIDQPINALALYKNGLFNFGAADLPDTGTAPAALQDAANESALQGLVRGLAIVGYGSTVADVPATSSVSFPSAAAAPDVTGVLGFDTRDTAQQILQDFLDAMEILLPSLDDDSYAAMLDLRAAVMADIQSRALSLPSLVQWEPKSTLPALLAAQILYGDATRADEIVARNGIPNPGFIPGGQVLEVLNV